MKSIKSDIKNKLFSTAAGVALAAVMLAGSYVPHANQAPTRSHAAALLSPVVMSVQDHAEKSSRELFGMVMRDPFYEYNTDPVNYPNSPNKAALERQASELASAGVRWVRMEFFADYDGSVPAGEINWNKYDYFIKELAPRYGLKVLALLNVGMVSYEGKTVRTIAFNDPPDGGGSDPDDGSNHFSRVFAGRAQTIAARYGSYIDAYEVINEPNISWDLWVDSGLKGAEIKPERYAALITNAYRAIKNVAPQSEVLVGGMLLGSPPEGQDHNEFDYLYQLYVSKWVERYQALGFNNRPGWNIVPWDGVAIHPYFIDPQKLFTRLKDVTHRVRDRGDGKSKLWVTEIGSESPPPANKGDKPTKDEISQAYYLRQVYTGILNDPELKANVPHVFWFKYEDFVPGNYTHNYGLVRLKESGTTPGAYDPSGEVAVHKLAYKTYQELARGGAPTEPTSAEVATQNNQLYFEQTGQAIAPQFAAYWLEKGGLERFGFPITRPTPMNGYLSQVFQRAIFEYHPEYEGTSNSVLLRRLGAEFTQGRSFEKATPETVPSDRAYYPQTGHTLGGAFGRFWQENGGLAVYGYPISEEIAEVSPTDGQSYVVQYFERNRFELHPEAHATPYEVQLGLLGANLLETDRWWR